MTTMTHEPSTDTPAGDTRASEGIAARLFVPAFWGTLAIVTMWLAVLFDGVFGGDMVFNNTNGMTTIPSAVLVALFAVIGTASVAKRVFGRKND
jgi:uncharacterized RDD family membrane protein YckC